MAEWRLALVYPKMNVFIIYTFHARNASYQLSQKFGSTYSFFIYIFSDQNYIITVGIMLQIKEYEKNLLPHVY